VAVIAKAAAGQIEAQTAQPIHAAGRGIHGTGPFMAKQSVGHSAQHKPQPVQAVSLRTGISRPCQGVGADIGNLRLDMATPRQPMKNSKEPRTR
jgi:hypothetical protein